MSSSVQLLDFHDFTSSQVIFSDPTYVRNSHNKIINIMTKNDDGRLTDLIVNTPPHLMSFGIQEIRDRNTQEVVGFQLPLCLYAKNGPTDDEKKFVETIQSFAGECKDFVLERRHDLRDGHEITADDLSRMDPISWKVSDPPQSPMLYAKLIVNRRSHSIMTVFINEETNQEIDPMTLINKRFLATAALKIENIFIGNRISIHVKLYEVLVKFITSRPRNVYQPRSILRPSIPIKNSSSTNEKSYSNPFKVLDDDAT